MKEKLKKLKKNRLLVVFGYLLITLTMCYPLKGICQNDNILTVEEIAFAYFSETIMLNEYVLKDKLICFKKSTIGKYGKIYDIASCRGDINLFIDSIPNKREIDSLEKINSKVNLKKIKISNSKFKSGLFQSKRTLNLYVYNVVLYKELYCVEFVLLNKLNTSITVVVFLNENKHPLDYCIKTITY